MNENGFSDVKNIDPDKPQVEEAAAAASTPAEESPEILAMKQELETWKQKAEELEKKEPVKEVVYQLPEDYVSIMENHENRRLLDTDPTQMSDVDLFKQVLQREKPWLTTNSMLENEIKKQFPEADFDIPENLGLSEEDWGEIRFKADGERTQLSQQKSDLMAKIDAAKQTALQSKGTEDAEAHRQQVEKMLSDEFQAGLASKVVHKVEVSLEGFDLPTVSDQEIEEMFTNGNALFKVVEGKGFVPDVQAMHDAILLRKTNESLKPMVEAAKRIAPKEAREALEASLANKPIHNKDNGGVRSTDPNAKPEWVSPYSDVRMINN